MVSGMEPPQILKLIKLDKTRVTFEIERSAVETESENSDTDTENLLSESENKVDQSILDSRTVF